MTTQYHSIQSLIYLLPFGWNSNVKLPPSPIWGVTVNLGGQKWYKSKYWHQWPNMPSNSTSITLWTYLSLFGHNTQHSRQTDNQNRQCVCCFMALQQPRSWAPRCSRKITWCMQFKVIPRTIDRVIGIVCCYSTGSLKFSIFSWHNCYSHWPWDFQHWLTLFLGL